MTQAEDFFNLMPKIWEREISGNDNANKEAARRGATRAAPTTRGGEPGTIWAFLDGSRVYIARHGSEVQLANYSKAV